MQVLGDEYDRESAGSADDNSENEQDELGDDRNDLDIDRDVDPEDDGEGEVENDEENEDNEDEEDEQDQDDSQYSSSYLQSRDSGKAIANKSENAQASVNSGDRLPSAPTSHPNPSVSLISPSSLQAPPLATNVAFDALKIRAEMLTAPVYDMVPTIAAPHSTSINAICAMPDLRWVFSGGSDGYIRKFDWHATVNGKVMLTVAQRHPFVDSVTKAGVLVSYWENEDFQSKPSSGDDGLSLSPVYSLAVHREALWLLSGLESGGINLQAIRHDEGKLIHCLRKHTSAVSVLDLARDEKSVLSGSWDKTVIEWDLDTGSIKRTFGGSGSQISALEMRPLSDLPVPRVLGEVSYSSSTFFANNLDKPRHNGVLIDGPGDSDRLGNGSIGRSTVDDVVSPADSLFGGNDGDSLFGDNDEGDGGAPSGGNFVGEDDDEFSRAIATGIREQDNEEASGDVHMADTDNQMMVPSSNGTTDHKPLSSSDLIGNQEAVPSSMVSNLSYAEDIPHESGESLSLPSAVDSISVADSVFLAASINGSIRVWDKRQPTAIAKITPQNVPPWCMAACWSPDGNFIYAGRRNGTVEEFSLHKGLRGAERSFKLPNGSGPVSAVRAMPNGRHLVCASYDILRLYDLQQQQTFKHSSVPFLIVPGHRTGVVSQLYIDPTCRYMISTAGNRGWEGSSTEVLLGYEIGVG